jgi:hypothetical protein
MDQTEVIIVKETGRDIIKYKYTGSKKSSLKTIALGSVIIMGYYIKSIDTVVGYDDLNNLFLFQLESQKGLPNFDVIEEPYIYRAIKVFDNTLIYVSSKNVLKVIPDLDFVILQLQKLVLTIKISPDKQIIDYAMDHRLNLIFVLTKCGSLYTFDFFSGEKMNKCNFADYLEVEKFEAFSVSCFVHSKTNRKNEEINFLDIENCYFVVSLKINAGHCVIMLGEIVERMCVGANDQVETNIHIISQFRVLGNFTLYELIFDYMEIDTLLLPVIICFSEKAPVKVLILTIENGKYLRSLSNIFKVEGVDLGTDLSENDVKLKTKFTSPSKVTHNSSK